VLTCGGNAETGLQDLADGRCIELVNLTADKSVFGRLTRLRPGLLCFQPRRRGGEDRAEGLTRVVSGEQHGLRCFARLMKTETGSSS
jgi:hypothetical protein